MKVFLWIIGLPLGAFVLFVIAAVIHDSKNPKTTNQRIEESCRQEFGARGETAVSECIIRTSLRYLGDQERAKDDAAYGRVR